MKDTKRHLCITCVYDIPECDATLDDVEYGDGLGNDNVMECSKYEADGRYAEVNN